MIRNRTAYSFRNAVGDIGKNFKKISELCNGFAPITDTASTFGYNRWSKLCKKAGVKPVFGIELAVSDNMGSKKPSYDYWTFIAEDNIRSINELLLTATSQFRYVPLLTYDQANSAKGVLKFAGRRSKFELVDNSQVKVLLEPGLPAVQYEKAVSIGFEFAAASDNRYIEKKDLSIYQAQLGRDASTQTWPQWVLDEEEWLKATKKFSPHQQEALANSRSALERSSAVLLQGTLLSPPKPKTLRQLCEEGATIVGCNLNDPVYRSRMDRELQLIDDKKFEDYFFIIADICQWARQRMIVGPARGSSCGSLVCYLLQITTVDPIPYGLIFERFIDINRNDLPDIDIDFSDNKRKLVFDYMAEKYGQEHIARLGTVALFRPRSALQTTAAALDIPRWKIDKVADAIIERSGGDSRAMQATEDTLKETQAGRELLGEFPEIMISSEMEGQPTHHSQHAAGVILTEKPVIEYVAVDSRTGATHCDKKDAEDLGLLKIDALGLTQLSIFEDCLEMVGKPLNFLGTIPLDDPKAFEVLNKHHYSGIFQFNGLALQSITDQVEIKELNDIVAITALARPGPLNTGGTNQWIKVKTGKAPMAVPHPVFEKHLAETLGVVAYQEQVMNIGREVGGLSWEDVTALRKAMSKSLGKEYFDKFGDNWKKGAIEKGVPVDTANKVWDDLCLSGSTKLLNPFPSKTDHKSMTLKQLYERGGLGPSNGKGVVKRRRQSLLMWDGKSLKPAPNWGVKYSGKKITYTLKTESGNAIRATAEHKFLTPNEGYIELQNLKVGDEVLSDAGAIPTKRKTPKKTGSGGHNWWHKLKAGEPSYEEGKRYLKAMFKNCQHCREAPYEETHHINGDHENHAIDNLMPVCRKCHKKLHAIMDGHYHKAWEKGRKIFADRIVSIKKHKTEDVFDVHMPAPHHNFLAEGIVVHNCAYGSWAFNKSHAVAYGIVSYYCCWLKAYYPVEFAAATLSHTDSDQSKIMMLREMNHEGIKYLPVDKDHSKLTWAVGWADNQKILVGPLTSVKGLGPKLANQILSARSRGETLNGRAAKLLENPKTDIDDLWPIGSRFKALMPDPTERNIFTPNTLVKQCQTIGTDKEVLVFCTISQIKPKDENEEINVAKRNGKVLTGPTQSLNLRLTDDTDTIFGKVDRYKFEILGRPIVERGRPGKALYAIKGIIPPDFRMIRVMAVRYIGDLDE